MESYSFLHDNERGGDGCITLFFLLNLGESWDEEYYFRWERDLLVRSNLFIFYELLFITTFYEPSKKIRKNGKLLQLTGPLPMNQSAISDRLFLPFKIKSKYKS